MIDDKWIKTKFCSGLFKNKGIKTTIFFLGLEWGDSESNQKVKRRNMIGKREVRYISTLKYVFSEEKE